MLPLEKKHAHQRDCFITFDPVKHVYTVTHNGVAERVPVSVTSFSKHCFSQFDGPAVVEQYYARWKHSPDCKYYSTIRATLSSGGTDEDAKRAILQDWADVGETASASGTHMHELCELVCNGVIEPAQETKETRLLRAWLADFQPEMRWKPFRTEWKLWFDEQRLGGAVLVAGMLDLLLVSEATGYVRSTRTRFCQNCPSCFAFCTKMCLCASRQYALVDFKRCSPAPKFQGGPLSLLGPATRYHPGWAMSPLSETENSKFGQYSMQLNILSKILRDRYDINVEERMFLLQIHEDMDEAHCVQVEACVEQTHTLFAIETERRALMESGFD